MTETPTDHGNDLPRWLDAATGAWAMLRHNQDWRNPASDIDVVADTPASVIAEYLESAFDVVPIMLCNYDIPTAEAVWLSTRDGRTLHLDVLCDPDGLGRLAFPTLIALETRTDVDGIPQVNAAWSLAYETAKRVHKRQWDRAAALQIEPELDESEVARALSFVFGCESSLALELLRERTSPERWQDLAPRLERGRWAARTHRHPEGRLGLLRDQAVRYLRRMRSPVAPWLHVTGRAARTTAELAERDLKTSTHRTMARSTDASRLRNALEIVAFRRRPGFVVTWGRTTPLFGRPTVSIVADDEQTWRSSRAEVLLAFSHGWRL